MIGWRHVAAIAGVILTLFVAAGVGRWTPRCTSGTQNVSAVETQPGVFCTAVAICEDGRWEEWVNPVSCHRVGG